MRYLHLLLLTWCLPVVQCSFLGFEKDVADVLEEKVLRSVRDVDSPALKRRLRIPIYPVLTHFRDNNNTMWSEILGPPRTSTSKPAVITAASRLEIPPTSLEASNDELHISATNAVASVQKPPENPRTVITAKTGNFVVPVTPSSKRKLFQTRLQRVTTTSTTAQPQEDSSEDVSSEEEEEAEEVTTMITPSTYRPNLVVVRQRLANLRLQTQREVKPSKNYISTDRESQLLGHALKTKPAKITSTISSSDLEDKQEVTTSTTQRPRLPQRFWTRTTGSSTTTTTTVSTTSTTSTTSKPSTTTVTASTTTEQSDFGPEAPFFDEGVVVVQTEIAAPSESHYYHEGGEEDNPVVVVEASSAHVDEQQVGMVNHNHFYGAEVAVPDVQVYGDKR